MLKSTFFKIHKWLGLISGALVMIIAFTGLLYLFSGDIRPAIHPQRYFLNQQQTGKTPLPMSRLLQSAHTVLKQGEKITRLDIFPDPKRTWIVRVQKINEKAIFYWNYYVSYRRIYLNPFTGKVKKIENSKTDFFEVALQIHRNLLMGESVGKLIIGCATICFILILISGIFLWWPRKWSKKKLKSHLSIKTKAKKNRLIYDFHRVSGFYVCAILIITTVTGLVIGYPKFKVAYSQFFNQFDQQIAVGITPQHQIINTPYENPEDNACYYVLESEHQADMISCRLRKPYPEKINFQVRLLKHRTGKYRWYYFDEYGKVLNRVKSYQGENIGDRLGSSNYDIHAGLVWGKLSQILLALAMIVLLSLPVTGLMIFINRKRKRKKKSNSQKL